MITAYFTSKRRRFLAGMPAAAVAIVAGCGALLTSTASAAADFTWRFGTNIAESSPSYQLLAETVRTIEAESGQRLQIDIKPINGYGRPAELLPLLDKGDIEVALASVGYFANRFAANSVMELPLLYKSATAGTKVLWQLYQDGDLNRDFHDLKVISMWMLPPYGVFSSQRKVTTARDFRGLRIRVFSLTSGRAIARLGGIPLNVPSDRIGEALAVGALDAITFSWESMSTSPGGGGKMMIDQVKYLLDLKYAAPELAILMKPRVFDALPADLQAVVERHTGRTLSMALAAQRDEADAAVRKKLAADPRFVVSSLAPAEAAATERALAPALTDWATLIRSQGVDGEALLARARTLAATANAQDSQ
jgi:TRAP-type C4-dicarboxylate transport system substrate-binding protein